MLDIVEEALNDPEYRYRYVRLDGTSSQVVVGLAFSHLFQHERQLVLKRFSEEPKVCFGKIPLKFSFRQRFVL